MTANGETTPKKHRGLTEPWKPGQSGNPAGRPKGSRNKVGEEFLKDFLGVWELRGKQALEDVAENDPSTFIRVAASLLPKELKIEHTNELTDDQLDARIRQLASIIGLEMGIGGAAEREAETPKPQSPGDVPSVH